MPTSRSESIIWQSKDEQTMLIDIPRSISSAQGALDQPCRDLLSSTPAQAEPYKTNEPKSAAARMKLVGNTVDAEYHKVYAELLDNALNTIRSAYDGPWCQPRLFIETPEETGPKRKLDERDANDLTEHKDGARTMIRSTRPQAEVPENILPILSQQSFSIVHGIEPTEGDHPYQYHPASDGNTRASFSVSKSENCGSEHVFFLPPESSFILGPCSDPHPLHTSVRAQAQELEVSRKFDFILLDPPWPNRSVKRTHKTAHSTYSTAQSLGEIHQLIMGMDLDILMTESCLVAIWITNKPAVRDLVLGEDGLFDCWGVELIEEWVWLKTTVHGEPVTPIDSVWRKPYEVLLLGRKRREYAMHSEASTRRHEAISRKILVSVPDLHSRKPCLKEMIERLVPNPESYRALEVFARHLVAGWWSWGDECVKFNGKQHWQCEASAKHEEVCHV